MIQKVVHKGKLQDLSEVKQNLAYWLSRLPEQRIDAVERFRRERHGNDQRLQRVLALFNAHSVDFVIIGAYALAYHGSPRYTGDLDIYLRPDRENAGHVLSALDAFGFGALNITVDDLAVPGMVVQLGYPPVRIDLVTSITGVTWEEAAAGRIPGTYGDVPVTYLGKREMIRNKRALGRKKDEADIEALGE